MKFRLPKSVEIGPIKFKVVETDLGGEDLGQCDYERGLIKIQIGLNDDLKRETYLHEVVEAVDVIAELKLPHHKIQTLGALLAQAFKTAR